MKRASEYGQEKSQNNKKTKPDNLQWAASNKASLSDEENSNEKKSLSDKDKSVYESSSEDAPDKTILNSSLFSETEDEADKTVIDSSKSSMSNLEITKSDDAIIEEKPSFNKAKDLIKSYIATLEEGVPHKATCDHIIELILEIYTDVRSYIEVLNQIVEDVEGIREGKETFESICGLAISITGYDRRISDIYTGEVPQDKVELADMIAGEVYNFICDSYHIE